MTPREPIPAETERIASEVIDAAYKVYKALGPGLLESVYEACLFHELTRRGIRVRRQVPVTIEYEGIKLESGLVLDLLVEDCIIVELKAVETVPAVYESQLLSHMKLARIRLGFLINFNVYLFKDAVRRKVL